MPPFKYPATFTDTVIDTADQSWHSVSEAPVAAAIAAGQVLAADPPPIRDADGRTLPKRRIQTANATATEIFRAPVPQNTAYKAILTIWGITPDLANFRMIEATVVVGRAAGNVAIVQTRVSPANATIQADHAVGTGGTWPLPTVATDNAGGNRDVLIRVTGAASTVIDWLLTGRYETFTPGGT